MTAPKPATALPWRCNAIKGNRIVGDASTTDAEKWHLNGANNTIARFFRPGDAAFAFAACNTYPQLVADRARLIAALQKTNELVARGHVEGAYNAIAAGPQYAERVMAATASLLRELGEG